MRTWLINAWYVAGFSDELEGSGFVSRKFLNLPVLMFRRSSGDLVALEDKCPHRLLPLSFGRRVEDEIECGYHGMRFGSSGKCTSAPGQDQIPSAACVKTYPLVERHKLLWIWLGDSDKADEQLIPDIHWNDHPDWTPSRGYHYVKTDFRLSVDNLMDLGHESWVHLKTIGQKDEECIPSYPVSVSIENGYQIRAHREMPNIDAPPFFAMVLDYEGKINRWQTAISSAPSICMTDFGVYPVGESPGGAYRSHVCHLLTPETENTTHYFWSVARNKRLNEDRLTRDICKGISDTFDEDAVVLEMQQRMVNLYGKDVPYVAMKVDEAPIRARRMLAELVAKEMTDPTFIHKPQLIIEDTTPLLSMSQ